MTWSTNQNSSQIARGEDGHLWWGLWWALRRVPVLPQRHPTRRNSTAKAAGKVRNFNLNFKTFNFVVSWNGKKKIEQLTWLTFTKPVPVAVSCISGASGLFGWLVRIFVDLVCVKEKYYSNWKFMIVYDKPQPNEHAAAPFERTGNFYYAKIFS